MLRANAHRTASFGTYTGIPRLYIWPGYAVAVRVGGGPRFHSHHPLELIAGARENVRLHFNAAECRGSAPGWLIASRQRHRNSAAGPLVILYIDPLSAAGLGLTARVGKTGACVLSEAERGAVVHAMESCWTRGFEPVRVQETVRRVLELLAPVDAAHDGVDERVKAVVGELAADPSNTLSLAILANHVKLSASRLAHLFRRDTGLPVRQYRLWLRLRYAARQIARGRSLIEAAHVAGFADSAHFCRICRRMFGVTPSEFAGGVVDWVDAASSCPGR